MDIILKKAKHIELGDCDPKGRLRISTLLRLAQDIAADHVKELGFGPDKTYDEGILWVIAKMRFEIVDLPRYEDDVILSTWPNKCMHFIFPRNYSITDSEGKEIIKGISYWSLINKDNRSIVMPSELGEEFPSISTGGEITMPMVIRAPDLPNKAKFVASWSNCDMNGHMNNTKYLDLAEDLIDPSFLETHIATEIDVSYKKEIKFGDEVIVSHGNDGDIYYFSSDNFLIRIKYKRI